MSLKGYNGPEDVIKLQEWLAIEKQTNLKIKTETDIIIDTIKVGVTRMDNGPDF